MIEEEKLRELKGVDIVDYQPAYKAAFRQLNEEWITRYFIMEPSDHKYLDHPEENILNKGGHILFALYQGEPAGTCALIKIGDDVFELSKMAVTDMVKGKGIGYLLGVAAIDSARTAGAKRIYLESNTLLTPALSLYQKLGFKKIAGKPSPYERSNIHMELLL